MAKKKKIDTSVERMQDLLAGCPARKARNILACIKDQFIDPDDDYQVAKLEAIAAHVAQAQMDKREKRRRAREARAALKAAAEAEAAEKAEEAPKEEPKAKEEPKPETPEERQARIKRIAHENTLKRMQFHPFTDFPSYETITFITEEQVCLLMSQCQPAAIADLLNGYIQTLFTGTIAGFDYSINRSLILQLLQMAIHAQILRTTAENAYRPATGWLFTARPSTRYIAQNPDLVDFIRSNHLT